MAFTEAQQLKICRILGITSNILEYNLTLLSNTITAEVESQVGALILEYYPASGDNPSRDTTRIKAQESNRGVEINPGDLRNIIRKEIATLLYLTDYVQTGSRLIRG